MTVVVLQSHKVLRRLVHVQFRVALVGGLAETTGSLYRVIVLDVQQLAERLDDEDDGDQGGEVLLRESGDVAHEGRRVRRDQYQQQRAYPQTGPEPERQVVPSLRLA